MIIDDRSAPAVNEIKRHRADALLELEDAKLELRLMREEIAIKRKRMLRVADLLLKAESSDEALHGPAVEILQLPEMEFGESQALKKIKALSEDLVTAIKRVGAARQKIRDLGIGY